MEDILVPIALFGSVPLIVWFVTTNRRKAQEAMAVVMGKMVEKGETPTPELIRAMGVRQTRPHADLRTGVVLIALAAATILFGGAIPEDEAQPILTGLAMFPLLVGFVYTALWVFIGRKAPQN